MIRSILLILLFLFGCTFGPRYRPPQNCVSEEWQGVPEEELNVTVSQEQPLIDWWNVFGDSLLTKYIECGARYNNDILKAEAVIMEARALRKVTASSLFPQVDADFNGTKTYFSKNGPVFAIGPATGSLPGTVSATTGLPFVLQIPQIQPLYNALFDATWEIDLFGKTRKAVEAADATIESAIEKRNDVLLTVLAEISRTYVELRGNQKLRLLIEENSALLEQNLQIVKGQFDAGLVNKLDVENIEAELSLERSVLPEVHAQIYRGIYTLSILTGNFPETLVDELMPMQELPAVPEAIAIGIRSDLLRRRPDVRFTERVLAAATANVGVAVASFFPSITLLGDGGFQSLKFKNLFQWASRTWAFGGDINMPIFQGGNLIGNLRATQAAVCVAAAAYQQAVLSALENAESALVTYSDDQEKTENLEENVASNRVLTELTKERYEKGLVNLLDLLAIERRLNNAEQNLTQTKVTRLVDLISLYKALGGGWQPECSCSCP